MCPVDVRVKCRKAVVKTLRHETLCREMITLVKFFPAQHLKHAGKALQTRWMKMYFAEDVGNTAEPSLRVLECDAANESVHLVAEIEQILGEIAAVLPR